MPPAFTVLSAGPASLQPPLAPTDVAALVRQLPFNEIFRRMLHPLDAAVDQVPGHLVARLAAQLGLHGRPAAPARAEMALSLTPSLDEEFLLPAGTQFATPATYNGAAQTFTALHDHTLYAATLVATGTTSDALDAREALNRATWSPGPPPDEAKPPQIPDRHALLMVLSRPAPGMTLCLTTPADLSGWSWQAWNGSGWANCPVVPAAQPGAPVGVELPASAHATADFPGTPELPARPGIALVRGHPDGGHGRSVPPELALTLQATVPVVQGELVLAEELGRCDGSPGQSFTLHHPLVTADHTPRLETAHGESIQDWTAADSLATSGPYDHHFLLDAVRRTVRFSPDPFHGALPPAGALARLPVYHSGGGSAGNLPAGALSVLCTPLAQIASVHNDHPATGGCDAQELDPTSGAAAHHDAHRAVTAAEWERLALQSGLGLAQVLCQPPDHTEDGGKITLRVLPTAAADALGRVTATQLTPDRNICEALQTRLVPHLPPGCDLLITGFTLQEVTSHVAMRAHHATSQRQCQDLARQACITLHRHFSPLPGSLGRPERAWDISEIRRALAALPVDVLPTSHLDIETAPDSGKRPKGTAGTPLTGGVRYSLRHTATCHPRPGSTGPADTFSC